MPKLHRQESVGKGLENSLRKTWRSAQKVVYKDLPRLASRMTIYSHPDGCEVDLRGQAPIEEDEKTIIAAADAKMVRPDKNFKKGHWHLISNIVGAVAYRLETDEYYDTVTQGLQETAAKLGDNDDLEVILASSFENYIGLDSKTSRVFKATHQSIIFPVKMYLIENVYGEDIGLLKDVRRRDGWVIKINLGLSNSVTHTRWEQSLAPPGTPDHFEVQWSVHMTFDKDMNDLKAVFVRIMDLKFSDTMDPARRKHLEDVLQGGGYIV